MSSLLDSPPYNFSLGDIGLMEIAAIIGFMIACFGGGYMSDTITLCIVKKSEGEIWPEQRLAPLLPGMLIAPAGCILLAFACQNKISWVAIAFGFGMGKRISYAFFFLIDMHCSKYLTMSSFLLERCTHPTSPLPMSFIVTRNMLPSVSFSLTFLKTFSLSYSYTRLFPGSPPRDLLRFI
jgi:hypothetical protein